MFQKILIIFKLFFIVPFYGIYCNIRAKPKKTGRKIIISIYKIYGRLETIL